MRFLPWLLLLCASPALAQNFGNIPPKTVLGNSDPSAARPAQPIPFGALGTVANNAALIAAQTAAYAAGVWRLSVAVPGDAPPAFFLPQTGTCATNTMVNDIGSCVDAASGNSFFAVYETAADARQWGVVPDFVPGPNIGDACGTGATGTDNTAKLQAAWTAAKARGFTLVVPKVNQTNGYRLNGPLNLYGTGDTTIIDKNLRYPIFKSEGTLYECGHNAAIYIRGDQGFKVEIGSLVGPGAGTSAPTPGSYNETVGLYLDGVGWADIGVQNVTDFTYGVLFDGSYGNKLYVNTGMATYKVIYLRDGAPGTACVACQSSANFITYNNIGGPYTSNGPEFPARQARSSVVGIHLAGTGEGNTLIGGAIQYSVKTNGINLLVDQSNNFIDTWLEGHWGANGYNALIHGNNNRLYFSNLTTGGGAGVTKNVTIDGTANSVFGPHMTDTLYGTSVLGMGNIHNTNVLTAARFQRNPADPAATGSTSPVMMGLNTPFTMSHTGAVTLMLTGLLGNTLTPCVAQASLRYNAGAPPAYGAASTGVDIAAQFFTPAINNQAAPFTLQAYVQGLNLATPYWLDVAVNSTTCGTTSLKQIGITVRED